MRLSDLRRVAAGSLALLVLSGCAAAQQVRWDTYSPGVRVVIDSAAAAKDCALLDQASAYATATSDAHARATGIPNDALVEYIRDMKRRAGCP